MLDCQVADAGGDAGGEKLPRRRTKFIGISKHMELERARQADKTGPDPWAVRKFAVGLVIAIFFYTYYVFVVRVAIRMVRLETDRLGNRAQGVAYLIIFHAMFIMFIWSYAKAITTPPGFARDYVQQSDPPKEEADLVDVVGYRFEDQPARRHTSTEDLRASSDAEHTFAGRDSLATRETFSAGSTLHLVEGVSAEDEIAQERPSTGAFVPPFPAIAVASQRAQSSPRNSPSCHSPTTESFTSTVPSHDPRAPSTSGTTAVSSTATFPLAFPPTVPPKVPPKARAKDGVSPRVSSASDPRSFMNFPSPPEDYEANRPALLVERVPPQLPILSDDYRYDSREGFLRPYRSHRCKHCAQVVLKMDHHCPWVGTCVGARNYKYFYNFLQWSTAFTVFIFIALVIDNTLPLHNPSRARPSLDGQIIAIIAVSGFFSFFTGALFVAHTRLILLNMTTIEEMGMARIQARERNALARVYGFFGWRGKKETKRRWNEEWGRLGREGNLWWLGSRRANWVMVMGEDRLGWFLPIPASPVPDDGLSYVPNPRFTPNGIWRPRREWPRELR